MSITVSSICWGRAPDGVSQSVLMSIADRVGDDGIGCWSSFADHAFRTGFSEKSVQRAVKKLEGAGILIVKKRPGKTYFFSIDLSKLAQGISTDLDLPTTPVTQSGGWVDCESTHPGQRVPTPRTESPHTPDCATDEPSRTAHEPPTTTSGDFVDDFCFGVTRPVALDRERWLNLKEAAAAPNIANKKSWLEAAISNDWVIRGGTNSKLSDDFVKKNALPGETWEMAQTRLSRLQSQRRVGGNIIQIREMFEFETQKKPLDHAGSSGFE